MEIGNLYRFAISGVWKIRCTETIGWKSLKVDQWWIPASEVPACLRMLPSAGLSGFKPFFWWWSSITGRFGGRWLEFCSVTTSPDHESNISKPRSGVRWKHGMQRFSEYGHLGSRKLERTRTENLETPKFSTRSLNGCDGRKWVEVGTGYHPNPLVYRRNVQRFRPRFHVTIS